jgi:FtsP/CotA-like multicopper oxidase with cupredoxin domain/peroxiredoxin
VSAHHHGRLARFALGLAILSSPVRAQDDKSRTAAEAAAQRIEEDLHPSSQRFRYDLDDFLQGLRRREPAEVTAAAMAADPSQSAVEAAAQAERARYRNPYFRSGEERRSANGVLDTSLAIVYDERRMWRPALLKTNGRGVLVNEANQPLGEGEEPVRLADPGVIKARLRSYEQMPVGPTLRVKPGEILRVKLKNQLPPENPNNHPADINTPHGFNQTNLHTHGLHVSPVGNGDNVLLKVDPNEEFISEIPVPEDHIPGTFWYHAHLHGSTAVQVSSGMAGALIVDAAEDDAGALDNVPGIDTAEERICLFQQISYHPQAAPGFAVQLIGDLDDPASLPTAGQSQIIVARAGTTLYFRVFDAQGVQTVDTNSTKIVGKQIERERFEANLDRLMWPQTPTPEDQDVIRRAVWSLTGQTLYELEVFNDVFGGGRWVDGKPARGWRTTINGQLQPVIRVKSGKLQRFRMIHGGIRDPITVQFAPMPADCLEPGGSHRMRYDVDALNDENMREIAVDGIPLAAMRPTKSIELYPGYRSDVLVRLTNTTRWPQRYIMWDAPSGVSLDPDAPRAIKEAEILAYIEVEPGDPRDEEPWPTLHDFAKVRRPEPIESHDLEGVQNVALQFTPPVHQVNDQPYSPTATPLLVKLGRADDWRLTTNAGSHPFHIHVNPFYVVSETITDPVLSARSSVVTPVGLWKDTLLVPAGREITVRTRYERYIGDFVLHCHILDHEDEGMMMGVRILNTTYEVGTRLAHPFSAPAWSLPDDAGQAQTLAGLLGTEATVLVFLQKQDCPACNAQVQAFVDEAAKFGDQAKRRVIFVAPGAKGPLDPADDFPFTVVYDESLAQFEAYGAFVKPHRAALHGTFILDNKGQVQWREISDAPYMNIREILREVADIAPPAS